MAQLYASRAGGPKDALNENPASCAPRPRSRTCAPRTARRARIGETAADAPSTVAQDVAGQELPGAADVELVDLLLALGQGRKRLGETHDADRRVVEHLVPARLDHVDALHLA